MEEYSYTWTPPQFDVSKSPSLDETLALTPDPDYPENFVRIAKWCPDGSEFLAQCENRSFQIISSKSLYSSVSNMPPPTRVLRQPAPIVDFAWYPTASPQQPASYCFVASVRECPVKLFDASDGRLRASYPIVDHRERFIAPHSLAFNLSAQKLYCGFEDAIEIFDVGVPEEGTRIATTPSKKSKDGLKGLISALAFCPSYESDVYAAGSLNPTPFNVALFSESQGEVPVMFLDGGFRASVIQVQFNPMQPHLLYASFRRRSEICCWDIRSNVGSPLAVFSPAVANSSEESVSKEGAKWEAEASNQKRRFDIDISGKWLAVGSQSGTVSVFDLSATTTEISSSNAGVEGEDEGASQAVIRPILTFDAHEDSVGSVAFHPSTPLILSVSGSRHFIMDESDDESSRSESGGMEEHARRVMKGVMRRGRRVPRVRDRSLKVWRF